MKLLQLQQQELMQQGTYVQVTSSRSRCKGAIGHLWGPDCCMYPARQQLPWLLLSQTAQPKNSSSHHMVSATVQPHMLQQSAELGRLCHLLLLAGARVWYNGQFHTVADPLRHFVNDLLSLINPIGSVVDKVNSCATCSIQRSATYLTNLITRHSLQVQKFGTTGSSTQSRTRCAIL
jgi:hypothetical protein